jgi:hypothetical protein
MTEKNPSFEDGRTIINIVRNHFYSQNPQMGFLMFRVDSIKKNGSDGVWVVICSYMESFGSNKRIYYKLKVNLNDGSFGDNNIIDEVEAKKEISSA